MPVTGSLLPHVIGRVLAGSKMVPYWKVRPRMSLCVFELTVNRSCISVKPLVCISLVGTVCVYWSTVVCIIRWKSKKKNVLFLPL
jgi:hypothetical protein